jgi:hypothetical protein
LKTVAQLDTILSPYLGKGARTSATTTLTMLNAVLPRLYAAGNWMGLKTEAEYDVTPGYLCLRPDYECILTASLWGFPMTINAIDYQTRTNGPGRIIRPVGNAYGLLDRGIQPLLSDVPTGGIGELVFTCASAAFADGDTATVTYTDTDESYARVVLPLNTITVAASGATAITVAADGGADATTDEVLTTVTVTSTTGLVASLGITFTQLTGTDATYIGTFRIHSVVNATSIKIVKAYVALTGTLGATTAGRLMPVSTLASVESIVYASLPGRTLVKDDDGIIYADLIPGSSVAGFRRYECPQVPETTSDDDDWTVRAVVKRAFIPLTATSDIVYLDSIPALTSAFLAVVARDTSRHEDEARLWNDAISILGKELYDTRGGVFEYPTTHLWGEGIPALPSRY